MSGPIVDQARFNQTVVSALRELYLATLPAAGALAERAREGHDDCFLDALTLLNAYATHGATPTVTPPPQEP